MAQRRRKGATSGNDLNRPLVHEHALKPPALRLCPPSEGALLGPPGSCPHGLTAHLVPESSGMGADGCGSKSGCCYYCSGTKEELGLSWESQP